jgi:uncharacterized coiled-coil DUF342 family protein
MSDALSRLLDEVRIEAEMAVRTEYENTVASLRNQLVEVGGQLATITKDRDRWRDAENRLSAKYDDLLDNLGALVRDFQ